MNQSKQWLENASRLCGEIGAEDGVDPRTLAKSFISRSRKRKSKQLGKEAWHTLSMIFAGELGDPVFREIEIVDVSVSADGQFLSILLAPVTTESSLLPDEREVLEKCQAVQGFLRSAIAESVKRKRVPALKFEWVP